MRLFIDVRGRCASCQVMEMARRSGAQVTLITARAHARRESLCTVDFDSIGAWAEHSVTVATYKGTVAHARALIGMARENDVLISDDRSLGRLFQSQRARVVTSSGRALEGSPKWMVGTGEGRLEDTLERWLRRFPGECSAKNCGGLPPLVPHRCSPLEFTGERGRAVFIDADSCPLPGGVALVARRWGVDVIAVARRCGDVPVLFDLALEAAVSSSGKQGPSVMVIKARKVAHEADQIILELAREDDVIITDDLGLSVRALRLGCVAIDMRGFVLDPCMFRSKATLGDIHEARVRAGALEIGPLSDEDIKNRDKALGCVLSSARKEDMATVFQPQRWHYSSA